MDKVYKSYMTEITKLMPGFKRMVNAVVPDFSETIDSRVKGVEIEIKGIEKRGSFAKTERMANGKNLKSHLTFDPRLFTNGEKHEYRKRETILHEMLHATAGATVGKWDYVHKDNGITEEPCVVYGNASVEYYCGSIAPDNFYKVSVPQIMLEEGIVTDWSTDMVDAVFSNDFTATEPMYRRMSMNYQLPAVLCGCWNAVSHDQMRREFMTGKSEAKNEKTREFKAMYTNLYKLLKYNGKASVAGLNQIEADKMFEQYCALIDYFEVNRPKRLEEKVANKLDAYLNILKTGEPLYNTLFYLCDKEYEAEVVDFMRDSTNKLNARYHEGKNNVQYDVQAR